MKNESAGRLYIVATPIGNLADMTLRAVEVLKSADLIISEDTRTARKLLGRYGIKSVPRSYYAPKEAEKASRYLDMAESGKTLALISECGTPSVSDPGAEIVNRAHERGIKVVPVPGPSAVTAAVSVAGFKCDKFLFAGFIPSGKQQRKKFLEENMRRDEIFIFYESKRRILDTLEMIGDIDGQTEIFVIREMTKVYEEYVRGKPSEVRDAIASRQVIKGEFTVLCLR